MRIGVFGAGGLGGYLAATLARGGADIALVARGERLSAIRARGLTVRSTRGDFTVRPRATDDPAAIGAVDALFFLVKTYDLDAAVAAARPLVGADTTVVSFQNGVDNAERLAAGLGRGHVLGGVAYIVSGEEAPGTITQSSASRFVVGAREPEDAAHATRIVAALREAGVAASVSDRIERELWDKFTFICAFSGLTSLCRQTIGPIRDTAETYAAYVRAVEETVAVARAKGVDVGDDAVERALRTTGSFDGGATSSMQRDLDAGRPLEIDALNGRVVSYGKELGVATPVHALVYAALLPAHRHVLLRRRA